MDKFKDRLKYFQDLFGLTNWDISLDQTTDNDTEHSARTIADPRYHQATISVYPKLLVSGNENYDPVIVHELIHIVMAMYDYFADNLGKDGTDDLFFIAREKSVSELTHIFMRILNEHYPENLIYRNGGYNETNESKT